MNMRRVFLIAICGLMLAGCAFRPSAETRFYVLVSSPRSDGGSTEVSGPRVSVGPVTIPGYLDRGQLFFREGGSAEGHLAEFEQWGEPVASGVARVLCDALSGSPALRHGLAFPMISPMNPDWRVSVDVLRLDGVPGGKAVLDAGWTLATPNGEIVRQGRFTDSQASGPAVADLVKAQSLLLERLGKVLSEAVLAAQDGNKGIVER